MRHDADRPPRMDRRRDASLVESTEYDVQEKSYMRAARRRGPNYGQIVSACLKL